MNPSPAYVAHYDLDSLALFLRRLSETLDAIRHGRRGTLCLVLADVARCGMALRAVVHQSRVPDEWPDAPRRSAQAWLAALDVAGETLARASDGAELALEHLLRVELERYRALGLVDRPRPALRAPRRRRAA